MPIPNNIVRFDRMQMGLTAVLDFALGTTDVRTIWGYQEGVYDSTFPGDVVCMTISGGPSPSISQHAFGVPIRVYDLLTFTVVEAVVGQRYVVELNDQSFFYDAQPGDDVDAIRTGLLDVLTAAPEFDLFTAAATVTPGEFTVTPDEFGAVWQAAVRAGAIEASATYSDEAALLTRNRKLLTVSFDCFSKNRSPWNGAWALASRVEAVLQDPQAAQDLSEFGVAVWGKGSAIDISAVAGGHWETRVQFPATFAMQSVLVRRVDQIDTVNLTVRGSVPTTTTTVSVERP